MNEKEKIDDSQTKQYKKMTETPIPKLILHLGLPTTVSMLVTNIYNMADTYFVGTLGTSASGAVGVVFGLMAIIQAFGFMLGHGAGSIISRKLGEKDKEGASRFASTSFFCSLGVGLLIGVVGLIFTDGLMKLLGSTDTILPFAKGYAVYILIAAPFMTASCVLNNILRYEGQASLAMVGLCSGALLNIFGDFLLINIFHMGVEGAGISTAVSQTIGFVILLVMFFTGKTQSKIKIKNFTRKFSDIMQIVKTGLPSLVRQGLSSVSTMMLNSMAGLYGDPAVAAMSIVNRITFFIFAVALGIGQGFQPVSAFNYGAKKYSRVRGGFMFTFIFGEIFLAVLAIFGIGFSSHFVSLFIKDKAVIDIGNIALKYQFVALFFQPLSVCGNMMFQSIGKNKEATFLSMLRSGLFFIPAILILPRLLGLTGVEIAQPVSDVLSFFVTIPFVVKFLKKLPKDEE